MKTENDLVMVSSYQGGPTEIDSLAESFIKETAAEFAANELGALDVKEPPADPEGPTATGEHDNTVEAPPEAPPAAAAPENKPEDRGLERLVEREVTLRSREQELAAREARVSQLEARIKELENRSLSEELLQKAEYAPEEVLQALGMDPEMVVRQVIANRLGPAAPPEVKQTIEQAAVKRQINELKAQLAEHQRNAQAAAFVAQVEAGAREYVDKGVGEYAPTVTAVAKANPTKVYREILEEIARDANDKVARGLGGDVLSYEEAAKRLEARWSEFKTIFTPSNPAPQGQGTQTPASTTTPAATAPGAKATPPATRPPDRPIAPWLRKNESEDEAIKLAVAEFYRSESAR